MREQCSSKPVGIRRHYRRCALATPHIAVAFLLVALYLIFGPTNSDVNLVLAMPRVHVVFNEPAAVLVLGEAAADGMERAFTLDLAECELQSAGFVLTFLRYLDLSFNTFNECRSFRLSASTDPTHPLR
jgi:hypothetical protein